MVLGHSAKNMVFWHDLLGSDVMADASSESQLEKPDHCFHLRSVEQASAHSRRISPNGPTMVLLPSRWVLSYFHLRSILTISMMSAPPPGFSGITVGLHVKASKTILRC
jgi:hypothetical protein